MTSSTTNVKEKLRQNIRKRRNALGLTQVQLAILAELSRDFIYSIELGRRTPSLEGLCKIADALKVEVYELLK